MIYSSGDVLLVNPLKGDYRSNVKKPYFVIVKCDSKDLLITEIPGLHERHFDKSKIEWINGHRYRFEKVGHSSDPIFMKKVLTQKIS